jgi:hypothetical protein
MRTWSDGRKARASPSPTSRVAQGPMAEPNHLRTFVRSERQPPQAPSLRRTTHRVPAPKHAGLGAHIARHRPPGAKPQNPSRGGALASKESNASPHDRAPTVSCPGPRSPSPTDPGTGTGRTDRFVHGHISVPRCPPPWMKPPAPSRRRCAHVHRAEKPIMEMTSEAQHKSYGQHALRTAPSLIDSDPQDCGRT